SRFARSSSSFSPPSPPGMSAGDRPCSRASCSSCSFVCAGAVGVDIRRPLSRVVFVLSQGLVKRAPPRSVHRVPQGAGIGEREEPVGVAETIEAALAEQDLEWQRLDSNSFAVALPGEKRLKTACVLSLGNHSLEIEAFVMRAPEENRERVYAWL